MIQGDTHYSTWLDRTWFKTTSYYSIRTLFLIHRQAKGDSVIYVGGVFKHSRHIPLGCCSGARLRYDRPPYSCSKQSIKRKKFKIMNTKITTIQVQLTWWYAPRPVSMAITGVRVRIYPIIKQRKEKCQDSRGKESRPWLHRIHLIICCALPLSCAIECCGFHGFFRWVLMTDSYPNLMILCSLLFHIFIL